MAHVDVSTRESEARPRPPPRPRRCERAPSRAELDRRLERAPGGPALLVERQQHEMRRVDRETGMDPARDLERTVRDGLRRSAQDAHELLALVPRAQLGR
jgi:hypothetical protein